jgi:hypothetical protein
VHLAERAREILDAAENASRQGQVCSEMTILIGPEGHIRMVADSDWPLDSLARHHGAQSAYRVDQRTGSIRVEGRDGTRHCVLESVSHSHIARQLLGTKPFQTSTILSTDGHSAKEQH